jgi:hypothetical protein
VRFTPAPTGRSDAPGRASIATVAVRSKSLRVLAADGELEALGVLTDRRDELAHLRVPDRESVAFRSAVGADVTNRQGLHRPLPRSNQVSGFAS